MEIDKKDSGCVPKRVLPIHRNIRPSDKSLSIVSTQTRMHKHTHVRTHALPRPRSPFHQIFITMASSWDGAQITGNWHVYIQKCTKQHVIVSTGPCRNPLVSIYWRMFIIRCFPISRLYTQLCSRDWRVVHIYLEFLKQAKSGTGPNTWTGLIQ